MIVAIPEKPPVDKWFGSKNCAVEKAINRLPIITKIHSFICFLKILLILVSMSNIFKFILLLFYFLPKNHYMFLKFLNQTCPVVYFCLEQLLNQHCTNPLICLYFPFYVQLHC